MQNQQNQEERVEATPDESGVNAQSMLMNWVETHQDQTTEQPDEVVQSDETTKKSRSFFPKFQIRKNSRGSGFKRLRTWLVRTVVAVGVIGALILGFQSDASTKLFFKKTDPVFDDVTLHPLDEINIYEDDQKSDSSQSLDEPVNERSEDGLKSGSPIQTAEFTTENTARDRRGAWLTGTIESVETDQVNPLKNQSRVAERVQYFRGRRN